MILVRNIRLPLSAGEPQAFESPARRPHPARKGAASGRGKALGGCPPRPAQAGVYRGCHPERTCRGSGFAARCGDASLQQKVDFSVQNGIQPLAHRPVVCGLGPAGLFAALLLARQGYQPIVLERGPALDERVRRWNIFLLPANWM